MPPDDSNPTSNIPKKEREELLSFKYILGDLGIGILAAVARGAHSKESIVMLSGVPIACIVGRMPVLLNLKLIVDVNPGMNEYHITKRGHQFLKCINESV
jgi:hypothetical protein